MTKLSLIAAGVLALSTGAVNAAAPLMSTDWTAEACDAWNKDATLTGGKMADKWIKNDKGRGYKIIQMYRTDCGEDTKTEMKIVAKDGKAMCVYGGKVQTAKLDFDVDYEMHATTERWNEMGAGEYGPMMAMTSFRLRFSGPKWEAMGVMGPFEAFLRLPGKIPGDKACPSK
jgi:putative sterol carrier protein